MSADPIIYCLENLTDYRQFERLCSDIMAASGYATIDPLGGTGDRGRDALYVCLDSPNDLTVFAYTVRSDWRRKLLDEDCKRIKEEGHELHKLVFVCTSTITAPQKDNTREAVRERFGWELDLFDLERLRVRLASDLRHLLAQHPSIFVPPWFPARGGLSISESHDTLVIDHDSADHAFATWLARKLSLAGYHVWCYGTAPLAGENADESVRFLLRKRAAQYLPVLSTSAISNADLIGRCGLAGNTDGLTIPCWTTSVDNSLLNNKLRNITAVRLDRSWSEGLRVLIATLESRGVPAHADKDRNSSIALRSYVPEPVTQARPERVFSNVFRATVPPSILVCELASPLEDEIRSELRRSWAFVIASSRTLLAFEEPPGSVPLSTTVRQPEFAWEYFPEKEGRRSVDVLKELIRRSLDVACFRAGFVWCDLRHVAYIPRVNGPRRNVSYRHVDGRRTRIGMTGERTYGRGASAETVRYQLAPIFRVGRDDDGAWWVTTRIYVRVTSRDGTPFEGKAIIRRRKAVTKNWWNKDWFARTLGMMQAISLGASEIEVGVGTRRLTVATTPLHWDCPVSIDVEAVKRVGDFQEEMAAMRYMEEEEEDNEDGHEEIVDDDKVDTDE